MPVSAQDQTISRLEPSLEEWTWVNMAVIAAIDAGSNMSPPRIPLAQFPDDGAESNSSRSHGPLGQDQHQPEFSDDHIYCLSLLTCPNRLLARGVPHQSIVHLGQSTTAYRCEIRTFLLEHFFAYDVWAL